MSDPDRRLQKPLPDAILDIRRLLLTPNPAPRYPRSPDDIERMRNRKRMHVRVGVDR
jgi:hypothetical protein